MRKFIIVKVNNMLCSRFFLSVLLMSMMGGSLIHSVDIKEFLYSQTAWVVATTVFSTLATSNAWTGMKTDPTKECTYASKHDPQKKGSFSAARDAEIKYGKEYPGLGVVTEKNVKYFNSFFEQFNFMIGNLKGMLNKKALIYYTGAVFSGCMVYWCSKK